MTKEFNSEKDLYSELTESFVKRTKEHIDRVQKYGAKISCDYNTHDASKLTHLLNGYQLFMKPREELTEEEEVALDVVTYIHIRNSPHHPEYWTSTSLKGFTRVNPTPNGIIDASEMPEAYLQEMCADWCAMSEEFGTNTPFEWFQKVNGIRWYFTTKQQKIITDTLIKMWEE